MKDGLNALYERRSVRKYKSEQISDGELEQILKAGLVRAERDEQAARQL